MKFKCVLIDDEQYAIDALAGYIDQMPNLSVHTTFTNPIATLSAISNDDEIDFIFLDIEMPGINGLELAKVLRNKTRFLIFTTGHSGHAIAAYDVKATHYLLKPISFSKFALTITEILASEPSKLTVKEQPKPKLLFLKADQKNSFHYVDPNLIIYIEAAKNYVIIHKTEPNEQLLTYVGLNHVEAMLDPAFFIRISKSFLIAKNAIKKLEGNTIKLIDGTTLQLGTIYRPKFLLFLNQSLLNHKV